MHIFFGYSGTRITIANRAERLRQKKQTNISVITATRAQEATLFPFAASAAASMMNNHFEYRQTINTWYGHHRKLYVIALVVFGIWLSAYQRNAGIFRLRNLILSKCLSVGHTSAVTSIGNDTTFFQPQFRQERTADVLTGVDRRGDPVVGGALVRDLETDVRSSDFVSRDVGGKLAVDRRRICVLVCWLTTLEPLRRLIHGTKNSIVTFLSSQQHLVVRKSPAGVATAFCWMVVRLTALLRNTT